MFAQPIVQRPSMQSAPKFPSNGTVGQSSSTEHSGSQTDTRDPPNVELSYAQDIALSHSCVSEQRS